MEILQSAGGAQSSCLVVVVLVAGIACLAVKLMRDCQRHFMTRMILRESNPGADTVVRIVDKGRLGYTSTYYLAVDSGSHEPDLDPTPTQEERSQ
ncbi:hypothetical protein ACFXHA_43125 [Nocardia sp. NPDC059240]|uniref:hypothetical protein n=1 Tax=Nocardia sp. NPDC059240 TaxID=3346786 RepID=UPI0036A99AB3